MRPEVITILKALTNKSQSVIAMEKKTLEMLAGQQHLHPFIESLKKEIQKTKDTHDARVPFYNFYLAIILLKQKAIREAKNSLSEAVSSFEILGWDLNKAIGEWLFSTIHYENEDYDRAQRASESAIEVLQSLIQQYNEESKYEHAKELLAYLIQVEIFQESITTVADSSNRSFLQDYKKKIENDIEYLKRHKKKIQPTLVARDFYLYKILWPSHSVYKKVPDPKTEREQKIYKELLSKVGFFEIIEKLEAFEREFNPTASREEILEKINYEWDIDVNR